MNATANSGYQFSGFSGALSGTTTPQSVTMTAAASVTGNFTTAGGSNWYNAAWTNRRKLTVDHTKVSGNLSGFPMLVSITDVELKSLANGGKVGKIDGTDIVFTAADGITKLNHELESYNASTGAVVAWVQIPALSSAADTALYLYYGNAAAADQQNKTGVWDSGYRIVNHFQNTSDSTQYGNSAIANSGATATAAGVAGSAYSLDGITGQLTIPYSPSWNGAFSSYAVEFWIKPGVLPNYSGAVTMSGWSSAFNIWFMNDGSMQLRMDTAGGYCAVYGAVPLDNAYHQVVLNYSSNQLNAFIDGVGRTYPAGCTGNVALPALTDMTIGRFPGGAPMQASFDELRISAGTPRSQAWIVTGYNNQKSPSTFYSVGASETFP